MAKNNNKAGKALKAGAGLAALAAAAAGIYYFYGSKDSSKHRKALKGWAVKARGEIMQRLESLENVSRDKYDQIVDQVLTRYKGLKNINAAELLALGKELKGHWNNIMKDVGQGQAKPALKSRSKSRSKAASSKTASK